MSPKWEYRSAQHDGAPVTHAAVLPGLNAAEHRPHALHSPERIWVEKNCYADLWIELLHAQGMEPHASLAFVVALDFLGDQWTFFKPPLGDLRALYGIDVQELTVWRPLVEHAAEHLGSGRLLSLEVDAFWLPDTAGTDYRQAHTKTTIVLNEIDTSARRLGYFHNAGYFELEGDDFGQLLAIDAAPALLPPYAEVIHIDRAQRRGDADLRARSAALLDAHLAWRRASNPIARFRERFEADLPALQQSGLAAYHHWAFAGVRQLGAAFELASLYLRWLRPGAHAAAADFELIALHSKTLLLKAARAVNSGRALDASDLFDEMIAAWDRGMAAGVGVIRSTPR
jgi:Domain of unknown function (DUF1839)